MNWTPLDNELQLAQIDEESVHKKILIFKHSTRCSISSSSLNRVERDWKEDEMKSVKPYFIDLIANKNISNLIAQHYHIEHQSPQVLVIENGKCIYSESHNGIRYDELKPFTN